MLGFVSQRVFVRSHGILKAFGLARSAPSPRLHISTYGDMLAARAHHLSSARVVNSAMRRMSSTASVTSTMTTMDPVPDSMKSSMLVSSFKEELRRRQRVSTTYFEFPVKDFSGEDRSV